MVLMRDRSDINTLCYQIICIMKDAVFIDIRVSGADTGKPGYISLNRE